MHWRSMFENKYLGAWNLVDAAGNPKDCAVTIERVVAGEIIGEKGRKDRAPILYFVGKRLPMIVNKTNGKTIEKMHGNNASKWPGKRIILFSGKTQDKNGVACDAVRVRPTPPGAAVKDAAPDPEPPPPEKTGEESPPPVQPDPPFGDPPAQGRQPGED